MTKREALILSSVALLAYAETIEEEGRETVTVQEIRQQASAEIQYLESLGDNEI